MLKIRVANLDDRLAVANVLLKNDYVVHLSKEKKEGKKGNQYDYFVIAEEKSESNAS